MGGEKFVFAAAFPGTSRRQRKSFSVQQFFQKCCRGVGEQPTFAKQMKLHDEKKQKSKRESEESQLPSKSEGCNERYGFRGDCDSQASWGCAPALPNRTQVVSLRKRKTKQEVSNKRCIRKYQINLIKFSTVI